LRHIFAHRLCSSIDLIATRESATPIDAADVRRHLGFHTTWLFAGAAWLFAGAAWLSVRSWQRWQPPAMIKARSRYRATSWRDFFSAGLRGNVFLTRLQAGA
jgi:hypothetical protein